MILTIILMVLVGVLLALWERASKQRDEAHDTLLYLRISFLSRADEGPGTHLDVPAFREGYKYAYGAAVDALDFNMAIHNIQPKRRSHEHVQ